MLQGMEAHDTATTKLPAPAEALPEGAADWLAQVAAHLDAPGRKRVARARLVRR